MNTMTTMSASFLQQADIPLGAHLVTPRRGYSHHGIYVGGGEVVHYMGLSTMLRRGPVAKVTLEQFASGHVVSIEQEATAAYTCIEIAERAQSRLGEDRYNLLSNNCEHFCSWCAHGVARSSQVERLLGWPKRIVRALRSALHTPTESALTQAA